MSSFDDNFAAAENLLDEVFGGALQLDRAGSLSDKFVGSWDLQEYEVVDQRGVVTVVVARDYLLPRSITLDGDPIAPRAGDRIIDGADRYQILPIGTRPAVEDVAGGNRWLCHTKRVAE